MRSLESISGERKRLTMREDNDRAARVALYKERARQCSELADECASEEDRRGFRELARDWRKLAVEVERKKWH